MALKDSIPVRAFMIHLTHYDPRWWKWKKDNEELPFNLDFALEVVDKMKEADMTSVVIDIQLLIKIV